MNTGMTRTRWAAIGAAVAVCLGAGGVGISHAVTSTGERAVYVPIEPCRLADTRPAPDHVGPIASALTADSTVVVEGRGEVGECDLPADATGLGLNVTAIEPTLPTYLTLFPAGTSPPLASNLNPVPGEPPAPNAVTVDLSADGEFEVYNLQGSVHLIIDVVGYYVDHDHDDRYYVKDDVYTKTEVDELVAIYPDLSVGGGVLTPTIADTDLLSVGDYCYGYEARNNSVFGSLTIPVGATIEGFTATWYDASDADVQIGLWKGAGATLQGVTTVASAGNTGMGTSTSATIAEVVDPGEHFFVSFLYPTATEDPADAGLCGIELHLS